MLLSYFILALSTKSSLNPQESTPTTIPISVPINNVPKTGSNHCENTECPVSTENPNCGMRCWSTGDHTTTYTYTFKGERFQVYGTYDPSHRSYDIYIDDFLLATVNQQRNPRTTFALQYTSNTFDYGEHIIKIKGKGQVFEISKITYWPSVNAIRVNSTEILPLWNKESDKVGGIREWSNTNYLGNVVKETTISCTKLWLIGKKDPGHGDLIVTFDGQENRINTRNDPLIDNTILFETEYLPFQEHELKMKFGTSGVCISCVFYIPNPTPTPIPEPNDIPISIPISLMNVSGNKACGTTIQCPTDATIAPNACGQRCWSSGNNLVFYEYKFIGEMFRIFGTFDPNHHKYAVALDNEFLATFDQQSTTRREYAIQYTSKLLPYGEHTVRVQGIGQVYELFSIGYWPSIKATRLNITQLDKTGTWTAQADGFGGVREYTDNAGNKRSKSIASSRFWIYGTKCGWCGSMKVNFGSVEDNINEHLDNRDARLDWVQVYDSLEFQPFSGNFLITSQGVVTINAVYYITGDTPEPTPIVIPFEQAHDKYSNENYLGPRTIPKSIYETTSTGDKSGYPLSNIHNSENTYWVSSQPVSETFKPSITFDISKIISLEAFIYRPGYRSREIRYFDGFPNIINVYASTNGSPFKLVTTFSDEVPTSLSWDETQFVFLKPIQCDKIKLEFINASKCEGFGGNNQRYVAIRQIRLIESNPATETPSRSPSPSPSKSPEPTPIVIPFEQAHDKYSNENYLGPRTIPKSIYETTSTGDKSGYPLSNIHNSENTYWVSSQPVSETFKPSITFDISKIISLEAFIYRPGYRSREIRYFDGFPNIINVYASTNGSPFKLVTTFSDEVPTSLSWDETQFVFLRPIQCDKIKLEFINASKCEGFGGNNQRYVAIRQIRLIESNPATETPSQSPTHSPTLIPPSPETPTQEILITDAPTPETATPGTPTPETATPGTPTPDTATPVETPPDFIIVNPENSTNGRYDKTIEDSTRPVKIEINITNFTDIHHPDNGGAIHIVNSGLTCETISFRNCTSSTAGGGIYVNNRYDLENSINLEYLDFNDCKAQYGGAVYIYTRSLNNPVTIRSCNFVGNVATGDDQGGKNIKYGGSAIFLVSLKSKIRNNYFTYNEGVGGTVSLYNNFDELESENVRILSKKDASNNLVTISECSFTIAQNSDCSVFYVRGKKGSYLELKDCIFNGILRPGAHHIDGLKLNDESPKLVVKNCKFADSLARAFDMKNKDNFLDVEMKSQTFEYNGSNDSSLKKKSLLTSPYAIGAQVITLLFVAFTAFIVIKKRRNNEVDDESCEMPINDL